MDRSEFPGSVVPENGARKNHERKSNPHDECEPQSPLPIHNSKLGDKVGDDKSDDEPANELGGLLPCGNLSHINGDGICREQGHQGLAEDHVVHGARHKGSNCRHKDGHIMYSKHRVPFPQATVPCFHLASWSLKRSRMLPLSCGGWHALDKKHRSEDRPLLYKGRTAGETPALRNGDVESPLQKLDALKPAPTWRNGPHGPFGRLPSCLRVKQEPACDRQVPVPPKKRWRGWLLP